MRELFSAFYPPTQDDLREMWEGATIVFDTNALLNFYRYSKKTQDGIWPILDSLEDRLWIPHQVGLEFHRRRVGVMADQIKAVDAVKDKVRSFKPDLEKVLDTHSRQEIINSDDILKKFEQGIVNTIGVVEEAHRQLKEHFPSDPTRDPVLDKVTDLFSGRVGDPYSSEKLEQIKKDGKVRYDKEIPPGYKDASKNNSNAYGDWILWRQLLDSVGAEPRDVIFITDDQKEDWWRREHGKTLGPRPELIEEFKHESGGNRIHFYRPQRFWEYANAQGNFHLTKETLGEIEDLSFRSAIDELLRIASSVDQSSNHPITHPEYDPADYSPIINAMRNRRHRLIHKAEEIESHIYELEKSRHMALNDAISLEDPGLRKKALEDIEDQFTNNLASLQLDLKEIHKLLATTDKRLSREIDLMRNRPDNDAL